MFDIFPKTLVFSVLCFDLDETLIDHKHDNNRYIKDLNIKLGEYKNRGTKIVFASARNKKDILDAVKRYSLFKPDYLITDLGVNLYETGKTCSKLETLSISKKDWNQEKVNELVLSVEGVSKRKKTRSSTFKLTYYIYDNRDIVVKNIQKKLKDNNLKSSISLSGNDSIYITPRGFSKGKSLEYLIKKLNIDIRDVCVFGDSEADFSLFKKIKKSVLVANADDFVKQKVKNTYKNVYISKKSYSQGVLDGILFLEKESHKDIYKHFNVCSDLYAKSKFNIIKNKVLNQSDNGFVKNKVVNFLIYSEVLEKQGFFKDAQGVLRKSRKYLDRIFDLDIRRIFEIQVARNSISLGELDAGIKILNSINLNYIDNDFKKYILNNLAYAYRVKGENNKAERILLKIKVSDTNTSIDLSVLHNLAGLYREKEKYNEALILYEIILCKTKKDNPFLLARLYNNIGFIYRKNGEYSLAEKYYLQSLRLEKKIGSKQLQGRTLNNLGGVNRMKKSFKKALIYFSDSVYIRSKIGDNSGLSSSLLNKGIVYFELGDKKNAKKYLLQSYKIRKQIGSPKLINEVKEELEKL